MILKTSIFVNNLNKNVDSIQTSCGSEDDKNTNNKLLKFSGLRIFYGVF